MTDEEPNEQSSEDSEQSDEKSADASEQSVEESNIGAAAVEVRRPDEGQGRRAQLTGATS